MSELTEKLHHLGIRLKNYGVGEHTTTCPKCSHLRRKKRVPCLSVKIEPNLILYFCHHCGDHGGLNERGTTTNTTYRPSSGTAGSARHKQGNSRKSWLAKLRGA